MGNYGGGSVLCWDMMFGEVTSFDASIGEPPAADNWCGAVDKDSEKEMRPQTSFQHMKQAGIDLPAVAAAGQMDGLIAATDAAPLDAELVKDVYAIWAAE